MDKGKLDYFIDQTNDDLKSIKADIRQILISQIELEHLKKLSPRVDKLERREWKRSGIMATISAIIAALTAIFLGKG